MASFAYGDGDLLRFDSRQFDFNIQFEQLFFSILPSSILIAASAWRVIARHTPRPSVAAPLLQHVKAATIGVYTALQLVVLVLTVDGSVNTNTLLTAASVLKLVAALSMLPVSWLGHSRSPRPSTLLTTYLLLTTVLDATQVRTFFLSSHARPEYIYSGLFAAGVAVKLLLLFLESREKTPWINWDSKAHSPEETSGIFSLGCFFWLNKIFWTGYRNILYIRDLYPLDSRISSKILHEELSKHLDYGKLQKDQHALAKALARSLRVALMLPVLPRLALIGFTVSQPLFFERLLKYLAQTELNANQGYGFIGAALLIYGGIAVSTALYWYFHNRARVMVRALLVTEIYLKATQTRIGVGDESAALTLMSTDIERIRLGFRNLHETWACFVQAVFMAWLLYDRIGVVFVAPVGLVLLCFATLAFLMRYTGDSQKAWMAAVQRRTGLTATMIGGMKNLKISGLNRPVAEYVQKLRVAELTAGVLWRKIFIGAALLGFVPQLIGPPLTFAFTRHRIDASTTFTSLSFITLLAQPLSQVFESIPQFLSGLACVSRIQTFLERETRQDYRKHISGPNPGTEKSTAVLTVTNGTFGWEAGKPVLRDANFTIDKSELTIAIGPVGSGKTTLCKALLGEVPFSAGEVIQNTTLEHVGYCEPTLFLSNGTIRDNIVASSPWNSDRYTEAVWAAALGSDFQKLPRGDLTNIGSDGISLSGGQKQRVSLARALYLQADLLILDDIFSGLDAETEETVFRRVFDRNGLLRRRQATVVLCTHSHKHIAVADHVLVLGQGTILEQGSFEELAAAGGYVQGLNVADSIRDEQSDTDVMSRAVDGDAQLLPAIRDDELEPILEDDASRQAGDGTVYKQYAQSAGLAVSACALLFATLWGFFTNFPTIWLTYWTDDVNGASPDHSWAFWAGLYALLQVCALLSLFSLGITLWVFAVERAGAALHENALTTLVRAPLRYFTQTDTGVITNLFSQDLNLIDTELPNALLDTLYSIFQALGQAAVMLTSSVYLAIAYPFLAALLYIVGRFYLRTSRQLRLLDLEAKSPMYTHFLDTIKGIPTIRAIGFLSKELEKNSHLLDTSQRPAYLLLMIQEWLKLVLNLVVTGLAVILVTLSVRMHSNTAFAGASLYSLMTFGENITGIVLYYTRLETSLGAIARLKKFSETAKTEDREGEDEIQPMDWPANGRVELRNITASYGAEEDAGGDEAPQLALRDISVAINPGEKIAICGRTGSGKSSLVAFLLKLLDSPPSPVQGEAIIDDISLRRVDRSTLRQRLIAIPQDAVFLPDGATFQANLDPSNVSTASECEAVLAAVGLLDVVRKRGGISAGMTSATLSSGQRQLFSVSRAVLRHRLRAQVSGPAQHMPIGGLLLLDEVSSSVDRETEKRIGEVIRTEFASYTVIAVSHRLDMIMDYDRVIVMDGGSLAEMGKPRELAAIAESRFGGLVRAGGM